MHENNSEVLKVFFSGFMTFLLISLIPLSALCLDFKTNITQKIFNNDLIGQIVLSGDRYRLDLSPAGSTKEDILTVIVDLQKGKTIVFPAQSEGYEEFENFTFQAYAADPFQTVKNLEKTAQKKMIGEETLSGFLCRHYAYYDQDFKLADVWYAKDLQSFPIKAHIVSGRDDGAVKAKTNIGDTKLELSNIRIETVDAGMFLLPSGLLKRNSDKKEKNKPPAVTSILEGASPWGRRITGGGEIHVNTDPDRPVQIIFEYLSNDGVCKYWAIPAGKNADEIKPVMKGYPEKGRLRKIEIDKNKKVERVIIRADAGTIFARVVNKPDPFSFGKDEKIEEGYLIEKELKGITTDPEKTLTVTVTGDYQDGPDSEVTLVCYRKQYEDKVLEKKVIISNEQTEIWKFGPDDHVKTIELSVGEKGGIKYRIQQPDEQAF